MIVRLLLALLLSTLATVTVPASAAAPDCHQAMAGHERAPEPEEPAHLCIGCVPPGDWLRAGVEPPLRPTGLRAVPVVTRLDLGSGIAPALPPPRHG